METSNIKSINIEPNVVKRKKGRPRKEVVSQINENIADQINDGEPIVVEKKKRGRKKKIVVEEEIKPKKKRGRKAAIKFFSSSIRKKIPLTTVIQDNNSYILHIPRVDDKVSDNLSFDPLNENENSNSNDLLNSMLNKLSITENASGLHDMDLQFERKIDLNLLKDDEMDFQNCKHEDLKELYEKRIEYREDQDKHLFDKLDVLHKDEIFISNLLTDEKFDSIEKSRDNNTNLCDQHNANSHDEHNTNSCDQLNNRKKGFFRVMNDFVLNEEWLEKTNISCWWCCHGFENVPLGLPINYNATNKKFRVRGVFCGFACMVAYHNDKSMGFRHLITFLYNRLTGVNITDIAITPSPPRSVLKIFGGELSIEEFRDSVNQHKIYKMINYPMFIAKDYVEEVDLAHVKTVNMKVFKDANVNKLINLDSDRVAEARLRLSELEKSTISFGNTIDKFIKIS